MQLRPRVMNMVRSAPRTKRKLPGRFPTFTFKVALSHAMHREKVTKCLSKPEIFKDGFLALRPGALKYNNLNT
ncbi:hypothetical protein NDU88_003590 [Pleurodeles waltl]|uniref:Uncharacterized protein n=1 Tax=Pleurodeles waltl TaxID=8319 RepID=A0AAV7KVD4_PLEWA|nr:hypothetical protein NDU88_003590 [Pleurodeles waltl]